MDDLYEFLKDKTAIGARLKLAREANDLLQIACARRIGVSKTAWNAYEKGRNTPSALHLRMISRLLDVPTDWILEGKTEALTLKMHDRLRIAALKAGDAGDDTAWRALRRA